MINCDADLIDGKASDFLFGWHFTILEVQCTFLKQGKVTECETVGFHSGADENLSHLNCETLASRRARLSKST
jgi:hypothetical protein